jgi:hypothetical protein
VIFIHIVYGVADLFEEHLLRTWVRTLILEAKKPLAGLGDTTQDSPFGPSTANGQMSFVAEWAVYFAASNPGALTDAEWSQCQTDTRYSSSFTAANNAIESEDNESGPMAQNMSKVRAVVEAMKSLASDALADLSAKNIDVSVLPGNGSQPKPGNDEIDVILKDADVHVKLNDDLRVGGLTRGKLTKGTYLEGYISSDIYYRAIESFVSKHILDKNTAIDEYRNKIVDIDDGKGKTKTFITTKPDASSNISLGRSTVRLKKDSSGKATVNKKGQAVFDTPTFELSREMVNMDIGVDNPRFIEFWERSKIGGPSVHVPDPSPNNPKRTGYGVEFRSNVSPKDLEAGQTYFRMTPRGLPHLLKGGKDTWVYEHYLDSGFGNMKSPGKDPIAKEAQAAYFDLFKDKHSEFVDLLDTMGYKDAIVDDAIRKLFGVTPGKDDTRETVYIKFTAPWSQIGKADPSAVAGMVSIDSVFYPGIPEMRVVNVPAREGVNPSIYYKLYGKGALQDKELAYIKFRHFDGNRPPQVFLGADSDILTQEMDLFSKSGGVSSAMDTAAVQRHLTNRPVHTATEYFQDKKALRDDIVMTFLRDSNIVIQQGVATAPVTGSEIHQWTVSNWPMLKDYVPVGDAGAENDQEAKTWIWAMIAQELKDIGVLSELAVKSLSKLITEGIIKRWIGIPLISEEFIR